MDHDELAEQALTRLAECRPQCVPALIEALTIRNESVRYGAARALASIGPGAKDAIPALTARLGDPASLSVPTLHALSAGVFHIEPIQKSIEEAFLVVYKDAREGIGSEAKDAIPALVTALSDRHFAVRWHAAQALAAFGSSAEERCRP